ncbi:MULTISPECIES: SH3 domain-containing protein [unclassified Roseovarius]|uniref:SH3 domain-containing protein n=1 Tax=unclassified Roseovarius TaxID=2614913 RepID=UPI00274015D3|nr:MULTISPECIES: SH3 domain-containing protein [unclassified Roseovarius]
MWRFILVTFAFLGWSFYVLSGGADYEPRTQSWQARAKLDDIRPLARPTAVDVASLPTGEEVTDGIDEVSRALSSLDDLNLTKEGRFEVTLAALGDDAAPSTGFEADAQKAEDLTATPVIEPEPAVVEPAPVQDLRRVTGSVVNMRDGPSTFYLAIGKLRAGDAVEVLENPGEGWLKIRVADTGQEGWMADWLVTAAAN